MIDVILPLKTVGGLNAREHWRQRSARVKRERTTAAMMVPSHPMPCIVTMTRLSPGELDDDNLPGACKGIRDGIADRLGIDDRDKRVQWRYAQEKCKRGEFGVRVRIEPAKAA